MQREQKKAEKLIKDAAKRNDLVSAKVPAGCVAAASLGAARAAALAWYGLRSPCCRRSACCMGAPALLPLYPSAAHAPPCTLCTQIIAKEVVNMRRTVTKLAMNKATFLALSNQMTEQLGALQAAGGRQAAAWPRPMPALGACAAGCGPLARPNRRRRRTPTPCSHDTGGGLAGQERRGHEAGEQPDEGAAAAQDDGGDVARWAGCCCLLPPLVARPLLPAAAASVRCTAESGT